MISTGKNGMALGNWSVQLFNDLQIYSQNAIPFFPVEIIACAFSFGHCVACPSIHEF
jgi:hypothetical protein